MLTHTLKLALKVLMRRRFFTFISLFGTGFTLVVLMVVAAMLDHMLAPGAPETRLDRTLFITHVVLQGEQMRSSGPPGYALLDECARDLPGVESVSFYTTGRSVVSYRAGEKIVSELRRTDPAYWQLLQFRFLEGGPLTAEDEELAEPVAIISRSARRRFFGDGSTALGGTIEADGRRYRVKGVVDDVSSSRPAARSDIWVPLSAAANDEWRRNQRGDFNAMIVARDRGAFPAIRSEFQARLARLPIIDKEYYNRATGQALTRFEVMTLQVLPGEGDGAPQTGQALLILGLLGGGFLLLPTINLVNINISRIFERASEIGVRKAFGASSWHLVGQFVAENVVLSLLGGLIGLLGAAAALAWLNGSDLVPGSDFRLNPRLFLYALLLSVFFGILSGVYPAWRMSRLHPVDALKGGGA